MNGIYLTIYLIDHIVFCSVGALQVTYFDSNIFITIWCQSAEGPGVDNLAQSEFFPSGRKKLTGKFAEHCTLSSCIWQWW